MNEQGAIIRAIDVGFGNVKFTKGFDMEKGGIACEMFPSLAPTANDLMLDSFMSQRRTVVVEVGSLKFEVGPDSMLAMTTNVGRTMDIDFPLSDQYMALSLAFQSDAQISSRFTPFEIPLWTESEDFCRLLRAFEQALPLRRPSQLTDRPIVQFLVAGSGGLLGEVSRMLNTAAEMAIIDGSERITLGMLEQAMHAHA